MIMINPLKPFYLSKENKIIRMGNFEETGKEIEYSEEEFLSVFNNLKEPILKKELIDIIISETNMPQNEVEELIEYLINEGFIIYKDNYDNILKTKYSREDLFFSMVSDDFSVKSNKLKDKKILILGLGGVGANAAMMLSRAGFKKFKLIDYDKIELSNLIRQLPYDENDVGKFKTECLQEKLSSDCKIEIANKKIEKPEDIAKEIKRTDFVLCTLDKPVRKIRRIINKVCVLEKKPVIFAGFAEHVAMVGPFVVPTKSVCLHCLEKEMNEEPLNNVLVAPSYGPLCFLISSIITNEIINYYVKFNNNNLVGKTLMFNMLTYKSKIIKWDKKSDCEVCSINDSK